MKRTAGSGLSIFTLAAIVALSATPVAGQDEISRPLGATEQFRFTGGSGVTADWGRVQVGPYEGILESDITKPSLTLYCVDFVHSISTSYPPINVNVTGIGDPNADMQDTRLGAYGGDWESHLLRYRQAAFLSAQFEAYDVPGVSEEDRTAAWSGLHAAIWTIMTPGFPNPDEVARFGGYISNMALAVSQAGIYLDDLAHAMDGVEDDTRWADFNFDEWSVLTDVNANGTYGGVQEYLVRTTVTPEPETYVLLLSGMLGIFVVARRRLRELGYV